MLFRTLLFIGIWILQLSSSYPHDVRSEKNFTIHIKNNHVSALSNEHFKISRSEDTVIMGSKLGKVRHWNWNDTGFTEYTDKNGIIQTLLVTKMRSLLRTNVESIDLDTITQDITFAGLAMINRSIHFIDDKDSLVRFDIQFDGMTITTYKTKESQMHYTYNVQMYIKDWSGYSQFSVSRKIVYNEQITYKDDSLKYSLFIGKPPQRFFFPAKNNKEVAFSIQRTRCIIEHAILISTVNGLTIPKKELTKIQNIQNKNGHLYVDDQSHIAVNVLFEQ